MAERMHRTQVLLPEHEYHRLQRLAREQHRSLGSLVREAVAHYAPQTTRKERIASVERIAKMNLPVPETWEELEEEILRNRYRECCPDLQEVLK